MGLDERMSFFSGLMPSSSGRHSVASKFIDETYHNTCLFCSSTDGVTKAHIVASNRKKDYSAFGTKNQYVNELDTKSPRNFLPLCGTKGMTGTCHDFFDKYVLALLYHPFDKYFFLYSLDPTLKDSYGNFFHMRRIAINESCPPYRRLLAWRARYGAQTNGFCFRDNPMLAEEYRDLCNFSEESQSMK